MSTIYTISCGLDTPWAADLITTDDARHLVLKLAAEAFPHGHTIREVTGRWSDRNSVTITEPTVEAVWVASDAQVASGEAHERVSAMAAAYKDQARQEAVMVTAQQVDAWLV